MPRTKSTFEVASLGALDRTSRDVGLQLANALRRAIGNGELKAGELLPSTRSLAGSLGLSRGTVVQVFDQLTAEGYLVAQVGAGTSVAKLVQRSTFQSSGLIGASRSQPEISIRARRYAEIGRLLAPQPAVPFAIAVPAGQVAPDDNWRRIGNRVRATRAAAPTTYGDQCGVLELRKAIADYARRARAVHCEPEQVIVTSGTQQGLYLAARVLLQPGDSVWTEDPAYPGLIAAIQEADTQITRVPVNQDGIDVAAGIRKCPDARAAFVTPSHQYPLGMPLSMAGRSELLAWAKRNDAWVVEDDYDSELRYAGHPFPAMQGLAPERVVYLGTFSKVLFPSLRLGYAIVPPELVESFSGARWLMDRQSPSSEQHVLAAYMREGHFEAHIRRIRGVYSSRRSILVEALEQELSDWLTLQQSDQGMHLVAWLPESTNDVAAAAAAARAGIVVRAVSPMYSDGSRRSGLMLGFGGFDEEQLRKSVKQLREVLVHAWL